MNVALIARSARRKGGMESYLLDLVSGFCAAGHLVDVFAGEDTRPSEAQSRGARVHVHRSKLAPRLARAWVLRWALQKYFYRQDFDVSVSLGRLCGADLAICGGAHRGYLQATGRRMRLRDRSEIALEERCYRESPLIVAHSQAMRRELVDLYGIDPNRVRVIYPPSDTDRFFINDTPREKLKQEFDFHPDKTLLLFPSTGHKRKGLPLLLEAMRLLPAERFELVVAGSNSGMASVPANVRFLGFVDDMANLYRAADLTVLPSRYEPFGLVITESIACGTPVVAQRNVGACDLVTDAEGVVFEQLTPPALRDAILQAATTQFEIDPDFPAQRGLTIEAHIERLIAAAQAARQGAVAAGGST